MNFASSILFEDNHLLVVNKPAGLATMGVEAGRESLVTLAKDYLRRKYAKPGNVFLGVVSRLDASATGVIVLARTSKAAERLSAQFRESRVEKTYWALVAGADVPGEAECVDWLRKDESQQRVLVVSRNTPEAQRAVLTFRKLATRARTTWLEVTLHTGRKHQIRVQLAQRGYPILGDAKYGSQRPFPSGIALHAARLAFRHPVKQTEIEFVAPVPEAWHTYGPFDPS